MSKPVIADELMLRLPGLDRLWSLTKGRAEVRIAVLDGPSDMASVAGLVPSGVIEHGTHVQSIISGSADQIVPGLAPRCTVFSIPIFDPAMDAPAICTQARLAEAIRTALGQRANIINISAAQEADTLSLSNDLSSALQDSFDSDVLVVAAAGNHGCACDTIPASVAGVLAVGAHDGEGAPLLSSNWGVGQRAQGIIAPGSNVPGACARGFSGGLTRQDLFDPRNIACAAACSRKAGLVACLARCLATGEACDGGIDNCDRV